MEFEDGKFKCDDSDDGKFNFDGIDDRKFNIDGLKTESFKNVMILMMESLILMGSKTESLILMEFEDGKFNFDGIRRRKV